MRKFSIKHHLGSVFGLVLASILFISCSKGDEYKKYTAGGERVYAGAIDSFMAFSGKDRIRLYGLIKPDPNLSVCKIYWNNGRDSLILDISKRTSNTLDLILSMPEGRKDFQVVLFDKDGNKSIVSRSSATSYGTAYRGRLINRNVTSYVYTPVSSTNPVQRTLINWDPINSSLGALYTEIEYVVNGSPMIEKTPITAGSTTLQNFNSNTTKFKLRTIFRPDFTSIDTFMVGYQIRP